MARPGTYERLKHAIYTGRLGPGERIVERDLARRFKMSRIPLRESMARLQAEGLIRSVPYSSSFVEDFEPADILEIYSLRLLFEPLAARLLANNPRATVLDRLRRLCDRITHASVRANLLARERVDYEFHDTIVKAAGHRRLARVYDQAHIRIVSVRTGYTLLKTESVETTAQEHLAIVNRIAARDADGAERLARMHVADSIRTLEVALGMSLENIRPSKRTLGPARRRIRK